MADNEKNPAGVLTYKGRPLLRKDNVIYYGSISDKYISMLQIMASKEENGVQIPTKIIVTIQHTDETMRPKDRIVKSSEKSGLYEAMDIATIWLNRYNSAK